MSNFQGAPCIGVDPTTFFPGKGSPREYIAKVEAICQDCPMSAFVACAARAVENAEQSGVWAGTNIPQAGPYRDAARRKLEEISGLTWPKVRVNQAIKSRNAAIGRMLADGRAPRDISRCVGVDERTVLRHKAAS